MSFDGFVCFLLMESTFSFLGFVGFLARWSHCHFSTAPFFLCVMMPRVRFPQALELLKDGKEAGAILWQGRSPGIGQTLGQILVKPMVNR
jgi:hypothetical protein